MLPLLALTWMSAVLAMTDKRSILFQILFAVFDSLQGFVIVMVHCILRREVRSNFLILLMPMLFINFSLFNAVFKNMHLSKGEKGNIFAMRFEEGQVTKTLTRR